LALAVLGAACCCLLPTLVWAAASDAASEPLPGSKLPSGETAVAMAWNSPRSLTVLVQTAQGYALRDLDIVTGEYSVDNLPPGFRRFRPADNPAGEFSLAPDGRGLAVLEPASGPLKPPTLSVYRRSGSAFDAVDLRGLPAKFWPATLAWGTGGQLYTAAEPYLFPEQEYSVGGLDLASGEFKGIVLKANFDLVSELTVLPGRNALLARCGGYHQEYPAEPVIAMWDLSTNQSSLLHGRAHGLDLSQLDGREALLLGTDNSIGEGWVLGAGDSTLRRLDKGLVAHSRARRISPDGKWLGLVVAGRDLSAELEETATGRTIATAVPCSLFAFAPDSAHFAALAKDGGKVYYYELPKPPEPAAPAAPAASDAPVTRSSDQTRSGGSY
jgi:hypothetical protein